MKIRVNGAAREALALAASRAGLPADRQPLPDGGSEFEVDSEVYARLMQLVQAGDCSLSDIIIMLVKGRDS